MKYFIPKTRFEKQTMHLTCSLIVVIAAALACNLPKTDETTHTQQSPQLKLLSKSGQYTTDRFVEITGQVKNISDQKLDSIQAVATIFDKDRRVISVETSFIEYLPLMPGQTSPFKIPFYANPLMKSYELEFKQFPSTKIEHIK